jgi:hypothetical protein
MRKWTEADESVVVLADWNADVRGENTRKYMADLGMREVITEFHGDAGPRTHNRGSKPIYGIFMTQDLYIVQGGYMPFGMGIGSDHRCLWLDRSRKLESDSKELGLTQQQAQECEQLDALPKKEFTKHSNDAGNSVQGKKIGHQKLRYLEPESFSESWHATGHMGPRFNNVIMQG